VLQGNSSVIQLGFVKFGVKEREVVSTCVIEHTGAFKVEATFSENAYVCVGFEDFTDEDGMVACCELSVDFAL